MARRPTARAPRQHGGATALVATFVMACAAACGPLEVVAPLPTHSLGPDIDSNAFEGALRFEHPCLYLAQDGANVNILWPAGYGVRGTPPVVVRYDGRAIATIGDAIVIGGLPAPRQIAPPGCPTRPGILLGIIASVNGEAVEPPQTQRPPPQPPRTPRPKPR